MDKLVRYDVGHDWFYEVRLEDGSSIPMTQFKAIDFAVANDQVSVLHEDDQELALK